MRSSLLLIAMALGSISPMRAAAQSPAAAVADSSPFRPLDLPAPNDQRTGAGRPGPRYWQQRADYRITATLDTARRLLRGRETIHYVNASPHALPYLWLYVEQNICKANSITGTLNQPPLAFADIVFDFSCGGANTDGLVLESATIAGVPMKHSVYGTTMRVDLARPLAPGASVDLDFAFHFTIPDQGVGRMGRDGPLYEIAQWYPRMAVYDDVKGWNTEPYIGAGEFYLEYGNYDVSITVPSGYVVAATGELRNPEQVLTATQRARLAQARRSDTAVAVITRAEATVGRAAGSGQSFPWHFTATNVRDVAFAAAPNWMWEASNYDGILIQTLYRPSADKWANGEAHRMARGAIKHFSEQWYRYPWPHATTVEGPVGGMEYPMLTFVPNGSSRETTHWELAHEFGHEWFPMIVGSNERLYPWMDEGFNTFIDLRNAALYFAGTSYGDTIEANPLHLAREHTRVGEQPLIANPTEVHDLMWTGYQKPALMLHLLRNEVLGPDRFDAAFRDYIRTWAFKHPTPADFFRLMRDASGMELDWFWRDWVYTTARLDQAIEPVVTDTTGRASTYVVNRGTMIMPAELRITYDDNTAETAKLP
ncbi:MAG TPA: M1 family metallopeptidase, partial [Gemmatimonadaceae bacterium]|nr:M1 family metallopeptidase [Gemmatimonadaceae bacterium]